MSRVEQGFRTFEIGTVANITQYSRVKLDATGKLEVAGEDEAGIGFVDSFYGAAADLAAGDKVTVRLNNAPGTHEAIVTVDTGIVAGTVLYDVAGGKLTDDSATGTARAIALESASGDDAVIEVLLTSLV